MPRYKGHRTNKHYNGEHVHTSKLSAADVRLIDALIGEDISLSTIANKFGVSKNAIWDIKHGYTWKHITGIGQ